MPEPYTASALEDSSRTRVAPMAPEPVLPAERELLERGEELAILAGLGAAAGRGEGGLAVIEGTAGIGKSSLLTGARRRAFGELRVLSARAGEFEGDFPFGLVHQLFDPLVEAASTGSRAELFAGAAGLAEPLFDPSSIAGGVGRDGDMSFAMLHGLYWLAANVAQEQPTVLAIDDLHWADDASLRWLCFLARRLDGLPLLVVAATRPPEQGRNPELLTELVTDTAATAVRPRPLTAESIGAIAGRLLGHDADTGFCRAVEAATRGNPLFVVALLDTLAREGVKPRSDQADVLLDLGPRVLARAVALRLARLPDDAKALLDAGAVLGDGTSLAQVAELAELTRRVASQAARVLIRSDLWIGDNPIEFFHPVVRTVIYEGLDTVARSDAHARAARLVIEARGLPEQAAAHLLATIPGGGDFVVETLRAAARRSLAQGAAAAAAGNLERALAESLDDATRGEVLFELALARRLLDPRAAIEHLSAALDLSSDSRRRGEIILETGTMLFLVDRISEAVAVFERGLAETAQLDAPDLSERLQAEYIAASWWTPEAFRSAAERLAGVDLDALHGGFGSDLLLAYSSRFATERDQAAALARRAFASGRLVASGALGFHFAATVLVSSGLVDEAISLYDEALAAAERRGDAVVTPPLLAFRGRAKVLRGDLEAGFADLQLGLETSGRGAEVALPYALAWAAEAHLERGSAEGAAATLERAQLPEEPPVSASLFFLQHARGRYRLEVGEAESGVADLLRLGAHIQEIGLVDNPVDYPWRRSAAQGLHLLGRTAEANRLAEENLALARGWGVPSAIGAGLRTSGVLQGGETGLELLRESVGVLAAANARLEYARSLVELGAALRRANRRAEARDSLREGVALAHRLGAAPVVARGNEEIAATGARPRTLLLSGVESLTASERRIAELAAGDRSNKEIAQALFVTVKTVEMHLSSVYRKLRINSRRELRTVLA
jgi:DNA-binding CsgD family transcriptional regulator